MSRRNKKKAEINTGEWLTTYADLMTLLLCFFVLLYAFSTIDAQKFKNISLSLSKALGGTGGVIIDGGNIGPVPEQINPKPNDSSKIDAETQKMYEEVMQFVNENDLKANVEIKKDARGVLIELQEKILFDSGKADVKPESMALLKKITELLKRFPNPVMIEGHTDNLPINHGYYQSNWELSSDRAVKIVRFFTEKEGISGTRFIAVGCGEFDPIALNNTPEGRQKNRRVSIIILSNNR